MLFTCTTADVLPAGTRFYMDQDGCVGFEDAPGSLLMAETDREYPVGVKLYVEFWNGDKPNRVSDKLPEGLIEVEITRADLINDIAFDSLSVRAFGSDFP
jgi:hypothetical protein